MKNQKIDENIKAEKVYPADRWTDYPELRWKVYPADRWIKYIQRIDGRIDGKCSSIQWSSSTLRRISKYSSKRTLKT